MSFTYNTNGNLGAGWYGTNGNDSQVFTSTNDVIFALDGHDSVDGGLGNDSIQGGIGNDTLLGGAGNDTLIGELGDDVLNGGAGNDTMIGGLGNDTYYLDTNSDIVTESANGGTDTIITTVANGVLTTNVENLSWGGGGGVSLTFFGNALDNAITGGSYHDSLSGAAGNDTLTGGSGNDTLIGGTGADVLSGGAGFDRADYSGSNFGVNVNIANAIGSGTGGDAQGDSLTGIEEVIGSNQNDTLIGAGVAEVFDARDGNDLIIGGGGADSLNGGNGDDRFVFSSLAEATVSGLSVQGGVGGLDRLEIGGNNLTIDLTSALPGIAGMEVLALTGQGAMNVQVAGSTGVMSTGGQVTAAQASSLVFNAMGNSTGWNVTGTGGADDLRGGGAADTLNGGAGNDTLRSGGGADLLQGGEGDDLFLIGTNNFDTAGQLAALAGIEGGAGTDVVRVAFLNGTTLSLAGWSGIEVLALNGTSNQAVTLTAGAAAAFTNQVANVQGPNLANGQSIKVDASAFGATGRLAFYGNNGGDWAAGGAGDDVFTGNGGTDTLNGGDGNDDFIFATSQQWSQAFVTGGAGTDRVLVGGDNANLSLVVGNSSGLEQVVLTGQGAHSVYLGNTQAYAAGRIELFAANASALTVEAGTASNVTLHVHGTAGDDVIQGTQGGDTLLGGDGNDQIGSGGGGDAIDAGAGDDVVELYATSPNALDALVSVDGGSGYDVLAINHVGAVTTGLAGVTNMEVLRIEAYSSGTVTLLAGAEDAFNGAALLVTSVNGLHLDASAVNRDMVIFGAGATREVTTGAGNDVFYASSNPSHMAGGQGNDQYVVSQSGDTVSEQAGQGIDTAWVTAADWQAGANIEYIRMSGAAHDLWGADTGEQIVANQLTGSNIRGYGGNDVLWGSTQADTLNGGDGDDVIFSYGGADVLQGGAGTDHLIIDDINTLADGGDGYDTAYVTVSGWTVAGDEGPSIEVVYLSGAATSVTGSWQGENLVANSTAGSTLYSKGGNDILWGSNFGDVFCGGEDQDIIYGYGGADQFRFEGSGWGQDQIADFSGFGGQGDVLDFRGSGITAMSELSIITGGGSTLVSYGDDSIMLYGVTQLVAQDFLFV